MSEVVKQEKPKKPHPDFPLTPHATKRWCKKIRQKVYYFGTWSDPDGALREYLSIKEELQAGIDPRRHPAGSLDGTMTVGDLTNLWLGQKQTSLNNGDLAPVSFRDYRDVGVILISWFGRHTPVRSLTPSDFMELRNEVSAKYAPSRMNKIISSIRMLFKWGLEMEHLKEPARMGPEFKGPSRKLIREARQKKPKKLFSSEELKKIIESSAPQMRAMVYLGINCGIGNTDLSRLREEHIEDGLMCLPRAKTAVERSVPLWPETIQAIKDSRPFVPKAKSPSEEGLLFRNDFGEPWTTMKNDFLAKAFAAMLRRLDIYRPGRTFYALRHTFQTIGDQTKDPIAVAAVMGHADASMSAVYREEISMDRLKAVTDHVREWLIRSEAPPETSLGLFAAFLRAPNAG